MKGKYCTLFILLLVILFSTLAYASPWPQIEEHIKKELQNNPKDRLLNFQLGVCYAKTGRIKEAFDTFNTLKELKDDLKPEEVPSLYLKRLEEGGDRLLNLSYLAFAYHVINDYQKSKEAFLELIQLEPDNIWNYNYLALVYRDLKELALAEGLLKESLALEQNSYTRFILGLVYYDKGSYLKAIIEFGRARDVARTIFDMR